MKKKYKWGMLLLVCFLLGVGLAIPILTKKEPFESITPTEPMGDDPPEPFLYEEFIAPENSFGIGDTVFKTVNWTYFKQLFNAHCDWMLEYKHFESSSWTDGNQYMTIEKEWNETLRGWKFNLILDVPVDVYSARFTFGCDLPVLDYVEHDDWQVNLNYTVPGTNETYNCYFNWSDMAGVPNIVFNKGRTNDMFWFRFRRDNIPAGRYEFDPWFGSQIGDETSADMDIDDAISGGGKLSPATDGIADSITVRIENWDIGNKVKCAIYEDNGDNTHKFLASTEELTVGGNGVWVTFDFTDPKPSVSSAIEYYLVAWSEEFDVEINYRDGDAGDVIMHVWDNAYDPAWPTPYEETDDYSGYICSIYCSYTEGAGNTAPTVDYKFPINASTGISLTPKCKAYCNDTDADSLTVTWGSNYSDGVNWVNYHTNTSVVAGTIPAYTFTGFSSSNTKYWWKVFVYDGTDNISEIYHFTTRREWHQIDKGWLSFTTPTKSWEQMDLGYLSFDMTGRTYNQVEMGYLSFDTAGVSWEQIDVGYLEFITQPSTRAFNQIETGYLSFETKPSTRAFNQIEQGYLEFDMMGKDWNSIGTGYLDFEMVGKKFECIDTGWLDFTTPGVSWEQVDTGYLEFVISPSTRAWNQVEMGYLDFETSPSTRAFNQISKGHLDFETSGKSLNQISLGYLDFETSGRDWNQIDTGYLEFDMSGRDFNQIEQGWLSFDMTGKGWNQIETGYLEFETKPSTRAFNQISKGWLDFTTPGKNWEQISKGWLSFEADGRSHNQIDTGYLTFAMVGKRFNQIETGWLTFDTGRDWNQISTGYLEFDMAGKSFNQISTGYLDFTTSGVSWNQIDKGYLSFETSGNNWEQISTGYLDFTISGRTFEQIEKGWLTFGMTGSSWNQLSLGYLTFATQSVWGQVDTGYLTFTTPEKGEPGGGTEEPELPVPPFIRTTIETIISPQAILLWGAILFVLFLLVYSRREKKKYKRDIIIRRTRVNPISKTEAKQILDQAKNLDTRTSEIAKSFKRK